MFSSLRRLSYQKQIIQGVKQAQQKKGPRLLPIITAFVGTVSCYTAYLLYKGHPVLFPLHFVPQTREVTPADHINTRQVQRMVESRVLSELSKSPEFQKHFHIPIHNYTADAFEVKVKTDALPLKCIVVSPGKPYFSVVRRDIDWKSKVSDWFGWEFMLPNGDVLDSPVGHTASKDTITCTGSLTLQGGAKVIFAGECRSEVVVTKLQVQGQESFTII